MSTLPAIATSLLALLSVTFVVRLVLWWRYRPTAAVPTEALPALAVVIPAFNEGVMVRRAIGIVLASRYPVARLHVIVVDDGSTDDTARHIAAAASEAPSRVTTLSLPHNQGKRHALYAGFCRARALGVELVATVDSDSVVPPASLASLVAPLVVDDRVGAVAGKVVAHNRRRNLLTRMLGVRYILGFDFVRAYQSVLRTVWCCPGALQAYRLALISPHLVAWRDQRFLGARCTNGDDHAMTNLVLSLGYDSVYQATASVETLVPSSYVGLCKMYVRWGRSATREGLRALRFAPGRARRMGSVLGVLVMWDAVLQPLTVGLRVVGLGGVMVLGVVHPFALGHMVAVTTVVALIYCGVFLRSERSVETLFGLLYAWFAIVALPWIQPFATLTVRRNGWMTRT